MNIEWTLCSERMPLDTPDRVISIVGNIETEESFAVAGSLVRNEYIRWKNIGNVPIYWTEYTQEKWEFLNR